MKPLDEITKKLNKNKITKNKTYSIFASVDPSDIFLDNLTGVLSNTLYYQTEQEAMDDGAMYVVKLEVTEVKKVEKTSKLVNSNIQELLEQSNEF